MGRAPAVTRNVADFLANPFAHAISDVEGIVPRKVTRPPSEGPGSIVGRLTASRSTKALKVSSAGSIPVSAGVADSHLPAYVWASAVDRPSTSSAFASPRTNRAPWYVSASMAPLAPSCTVSSPPWGPRCHDTCWLCPLPCTV